MAKLSYDQTAGEAGIPVAVISRQTAAKWFGMADAAQLSAMEKAKDKWAESAQKLRDVTVNLSVDITRRAVPAYNVVGVIEAANAPAKAAIGSRVGSPAASKATPSRSGCPSLSASLTSACMMADVPMSQITGSGSA